ncbi:MAG: DUF2203 domain-containing protein [Nitrosopumilales archaeon]|nr:DUF2203 domain-containing protein [Nitrosopumilales archaeon]
MFTYFTIASANNILPTVIEKFKKILKQKDEVIKIEQELEASLVTPGTFENYVILKQNLNSSVTKLYQDIEDLENIGVVIKSIDDGLLDFPSQRFDDEVWLCWKYGETEIKFWHEKDSGFNGRKPISVSNESLV